MKAVTVIVICVLALVVLFIFAVGICSLILSGRISNAEKKDKKRYKR